MKPFFVWKDKVLKRVDTEKVVCLVTDKNYTKIFLEDETHYEVRSTLTGALEKLPEDVFIQTHRAYAVSIHHIDNIEKESLTVFKNEGIPISKQFYDSVLEKLNIIE